VGAACKVGGASSPVAERPGSEVEGSAPPSVLGAYGRDVHRLARQLCHHREDAEDVAQSTLLQASLHLDDFRGEASLRTWLHRIATNECRQLRRRRVPDSLDAILESAALGRGALPSQDAAMADPAEAVAEAELRSAVLRSIAALPESSRTVLLLAGGEGLAAREIALRTQTSESAVRSRLHRARRQLRQDLRADLNAGP